MTPPKKAPQTDEEYEAEMAQAMTRLRKAAAKAKPPKAKPKAPPAPDLEPETPDNVLMDNRHQGEPPEGNPEEGETPSYIYNDIENAINDTLSEVSDTNDKALTKQERMFLTLHLAYNVPAQQALISSGYPKYSEQYAYVVAQRIRKKYESAGETREIFSMLNFGPIAIASGIIALAQKCPNHQVRLNALALAAKATGMLKDEREEQPGVTIVIKGRDADVGEAGGREPEPYRPNAPQVAVLATGPVALTK